MIGEPSSRRELSSVRELRTAASESAAITPERQPLATLSRNLRDRLHPVRFHP